MVEVKSLLGSLGMVLFGLTINKNIDCLLIIKNIGCFNKTSFKLAINYLLDNCYFILCSMCFCQFAGIPMLFSPDPFMVNLFLYYYERECLLQTEKWDLLNSWIFSNIFRFIDDLWTFSHEIIYPDELILKKENEDLCQASFLDLLIRFYDRKFAIELLIKAFTFPFPCMPFLFIRILCAIWIAIYHVKCFNLQ